METLVCPGCYGVCSFSAFVPLGDLDAMADKRGASPQLPIRLQD